MKSTIFQVASDLMAANGTTSTLEVKNEIHRLFPGCGLTQTETSKLMNELFLEHNWDRNHLGSHFVYKTNSVSTVSASSATVQAKYKVGDTVTITTRPNTWNSAAGGKEPMSLTYPFTGVITEVGKDCMNDIVLNINGYGFDLVTLEKNNNIVLVSATNVQPVAQTINPKLDLTILDGVTNIGKLSDYSTTLLHNFKNVYVCSTDKIVPHIYNTDDRFEARKLFKAETGAPHNDVRMRRLKSYLKPMGL